MSAHDSIDPTSFAPLRDARDAQPGAGEPCPLPDAGPLAGLPVTERMPALFLGHGAPTNALADNAFTRSLARLAADMPRPAAIVCVSAHWLTPGEVRVLCAEEPPTIHDFWGFPDELYAVRYPAPGDPALAEAIGELSGATADPEWGFDHASWTVLRHMYPDADVPLVELSLDVAASGAEHVALARSLAPLRRRGVLIVGSGNIVHNLGRIDWGRPEGGWDWAEAFDAWAAGRIEAGDVDALADYLALGEVAELAAPTNDHYLPLLYAVGLREPDESVSFPYEGLEMGALSMRCVRVG